MRVASDRKEARSLAVQCPSATRARRRQLLITVSHVSQCQAVLHCVVIVGISELDLYKYRKHEI